MKVYIAAGWFSPDQEKCRVDIVNICNDLSIDVYSPKEDFLYVPGKTKSTEVFEENLRQIQNCDAVIASTEGKDMGTLFECGYAFAKGIPIVYYFKHDGKFNLMLAESGVYVAQTPEQLFRYIHNMSITGVAAKHPYKGDKE